MEVNVMFISSLPVFAAPTFGLRHWKFCRCLRYPRRLRCTSLQVVHELQGVSSLV